MNEVDGCDVAQIAFDDKLWVWEIICVTVISFNVDVYSYYVYEIFQTVSTNFCVNK